MDFDAPGFIRYMIEIADRPSFDPELARNIANYWDYRAHCGFQPEEAINFLSDNTTHADIPFLLAQDIANLLMVPGVDRPYGEDRITAAAEKRFSELFETEVDVIFTFTGTGSNSIAASLGTNTRQSGIICHHEAHLAKSEQSAVLALNEKACGVRRVEGDHGLMDLEKLETEIKSLSEYAWQWGNSVVSITLPTEKGTIYSIEDLQKIIELAHEHGLPVIVDGTRLANFLVSLNLAPADLFKMGVDLVSFGLTKNGGLGAEAVVVPKKGVLGSEYKAEHGDTRYIPEDTMGYDRCMADLANSRYLQDKGLVDPHNGYFRARTHLKELRIKAGQQNSRTWLLAAQFFAYFHDDLYLDLARNANEMAQLLGAGLKKVKVQPLHEVQANMVWVQLPSEVVKGLAKDGIHFYSWPPDSDGRCRCRFITNCMTTKQEVETLTNAIRRRMGLQPCVTRPRVARSKPVL